MAVEVETPEDYAGNVMGDLSSRRGMVQGMEDMIGGGKAIKAEVPLSEMFGYSTTLRSMSQGRATYTMEFKHYSEAPRVMCRKPSWLPAPSKVHPRIGVAASPSSGHQSSGPKTVPAQLGDCWKEAIKYFSPFVFDATFVVGPSCPWQGIQ